MADNIKYYPFTRSQDTISFQEKFSIHPGMMHLSMAFLFDREFDRELVRKAANIEIERNDALRMRFSKKKFEGKRQHVQWVAESYDIGEIPVYDFSGLTEEEQYKQLQKITAKPFKYYDDKCFAMIMFKAHDGRTGLVPLINHLAADAWGVLNTFIDFLWVYDAVEKGGDLPKPLSSFEANLPKQLSYSKEQEEADKEFLRASMKRGNETGRFSHPANTNIYMTKRIARNIAKRATVLDDAIGMFRDSAGFKRFTVPGSFGNEILKFCSERRITPNCFYSFALYAYLLYANGKKESAMLCSLCNRRSRVSEKNCAGCFVCPAWIRVIIPNDASFDEAVREITDAQYEIYKHVGIGGANAGTMLMKEFHAHAYANGGYAMMTFLLVPYNVPEGLDFDSLWISRGSSATGLYWFILPAPDGNMYFNYEYRHDAMCESQVDFIHNAILKICSAVLEKPEIKISEIFEMLDKMSSEENEKNKK